MYDYRTNYEVGSVNGKLYDEFGSPFANAVILINGNTKPQLPAMTAVLIL